MLRTLCALMTGVATMAICAPAIAQTADGAVPTAPGEIVVTAQKRAERLQDVPVAVSAVTADSLARAQINDTPRCPARSPR